MPTTTTTMVDAPTVVVVCVAVVGGTHHAVIRQMMDCVHFWCICHFGLTILCHVHVGALLNCSTVRTSRCLAPSASLFPLPGTASNSSRASFPFPLRPPGSCRGWPPSSSSPSPSPAAYSPASLPPLHLYFDSYLILIQHQNIRFFLLCSLSAAGNYNAPQSEHILRLRRILCLCWSNIIGVWRRGKLRLVSNMRQPVAICAICWRSLWEGTCAQHT